MCRNSICLSLLLVLCCTVTSSARQGWFTAIGGTEADNLFLEARAAFADGQLEKAKELLERLRNQNTKYQIDVLLMLERIYGNEGKHQKALTCLKECTELCSHLKKIDVKVIQRLSEVQGMEGHTLALARQLVTNDPKSLLQLKSFLDGNLYWPLAVLVTAKQISDEGTNEKSYDERWHTLQSFLLAAPEGLRHKYLPTYASLVKLRLSTLNRDENALTKLDELYLKVNSFVTKHLYSPSLHRSPTPAENPFFPYVIVSVPNIENLVIEGKKLKTSEENFSKRWSVLKSFIIEVTPDVRKGHLFSYSRLVQTKLHFYSNSQKACKELDGLIDRVAVYLADQSSQRH